MKPPKKGKLPVKKLVSLCLLLAVTAGCGKSDDEKKSQISAGDDKTYAQAACEFGVDQGEPMATVAIEEIRTSKFQKRFNFGLFRSTLRTSIRDTIKIVQASGARVYRIQESDASCNPFDIADEAASDFRKYWNEVSGEDKESKTTVVGLYAPKNSPEADLSTRDEAAIGIRRDGNRWVLMHEFMHHLFETQAAKDERITAPELKREASLALNRLERAIDTYEDSDTLANLRDVANRYVLAHKLYRSFILRYPVEEMTIETTLQEHNRDGSLRYTPFLQRSSNDYIKKSAETARSMIEHFKNLGESIRKLTSDLPGENAQIATAIESQSALLSEISALKNAVSPMRVELGVMKSLQGMSNSPVHSGAQETASGFDCSHSHDSDDLLRRLSAIAGRLAPR